MDITWLGEDTLLLRGREIRVLVDPEEPSAEVASRAGAEIMVGSTAAGNQLEPDAGVQAVSRPGEYEVRRVGVQGVVHGPGRLFVTEVDDVSVCDFGELPTEISEEVLETLGSIDVLAVSLQGGAPARAREVAQLVAKVRPAVMVPVGYRPSGDGSPGELDAFAKEMGLVQTAALAKLTLSGSSAAGDDTRVVLLEARP